MTPSPPAPARTPYAAKGTTGSTPVRATTCCSAIAAPTPSPAARAPDVFHIALGGGADRVTDFNASEGDRVQLDGVTVYTVTQVGSDTVIDLGNGDQLTHVGVDKSSLGPGWLMVI